MVVAATPRWTTKKGREIVTHLETVDEIVEFWRTRYDAIFAQECRQRRLWLTTARAGQQKALGQVEAEIEARQKEWDEYVREQLADLATAQRR